ncbi:uncharacterized protein K444DRAFT_399719 [Hyaloscypha bicolor E]|uniref:Uncharacterized protein n=1 Tax=Hyaloscypha bicolor E TaxID=1095630 RepID=A0A2J6TB49_9HELO|nr:uncharacterized protein K444DRAFT_399719 [Hyaloscypha bicolor E]PMD60249.1 hypothetical protein K444DRAFT_399719 [Hyaloscypha bicolor E]
MMRLSLAVQSRLSTVKSRIFVLYADTSSLLPLLSSPKAKSQGSMFATSSPYRVLPEFGGVVVASAVFLMLRAAESLKKSWTFQLASVSPYRRLNHSYMASLGWFKQSPYLPDQMKY